MPNAAKDRGSKAEREVATILNDLLGYPARRALGAGRQDDCGDVFGVPDSIFQVANWASLDRAVREKLPDVERQMRNAGASHGSLWCRRRGGSYVVVLTPTQYCDLLRESLNSKQQSKSPGGVTSDQQSTSRTQ